MYHYLQIDLGLTKLEKFDWDKNNRDKNWNKHKVFYKECEEVFQNYPQFIFEYVKHSQKEKRFVIVGKTSQDRLLSVFFNIRGNKVRVVSARPQSKKERKYYETLQKTTKV